MLVNISNFALVTASWLFMTLFVSSAVGLPRIGNGSPGLVCHPDAYNSLGHDWNRTYSATEPQQVHTSLLEDSKAIRVQFATLSPISQSVLAYWPKSDGLDSSKKTLVTGEDSIFVDGGLFRRKLYLHNIKTDTLKPDTKFYYQVGSKQDGNTQWSNTYEFRSASLKKDFSFIATGDIGACNAVSAFHMMEYGKTGKYDFVTVAGDQGYDLSDFGGTKGDQYMNFMQDLFANVPYLGSAGNHEFWYNFSHYKNRFDIVPYRESKSENSLMYSINYKSLHLISFSTEVYFTGNKDEIQTGLNWLEADLIEANKHRDERPWIIFLTHHPIYCSTPSLDCSLKAKRVREGPGLFHRSGGLEEVLLRHKVDLYMSGHVHNYERTYPVANGKVTSKSYDNPPSMFQLVIGNGGQPEGADKFDEKKVPDFSALRYSGYGFSTFRITPTTMEIVHRKTLESGAMGDIVDSITITKNGSASANSTEASKSHPTEANKSSTSEVPKKSSGQEKS